MLQDFLYALTLGIMNILCGCAMHIKLTAEVSFKSVVEKADSPTQTGNIKKKIQRDII